MREKRVTYLDPDGEFLDKLVIAVSETHKSLIAYTGRLSDVMADFTEGDFLTDCCGYLEGDPVFRALMAGHVYVLTGRWTLPVGIPEPAEFTDMVWQTRRVEAVKDVGKLNALLVGSGAVMPERGRKS